MSNKTCVLLPGLILAFFLAGQGRASSAAAPQPSASSAVQSDAQQPSAIPTEVQPPAAEPSPTVPAAASDHSSSAPAATGKDKAQAKESLEPSDDATGPPDEKEKPGKHAKSSNDDPVNLADVKNPVLWHDPGQVASLDLYHGEGGKSGLPVGPFIFESEDMSGTNPKFDVRDAKGRKWRVKLGPEARPEVVASRLLWATGFYANDDYVLESADVQGLHLRRGGKMAKDGHITLARFARKPDGQKKIGIWLWKNNPFTGTKEFNGLRVMMAVMNNWDLKDVNNAVFADKKTGQDVFLTSDIGATFATNEIVFPISHSKGNFHAFADSKFIERETDSEVDFATPKRPTKMLIETGGLEAKDYKMRGGLEWIGKNIPRQDAKWMGSLLGQLSHQQLVDAFRAGNFPPDQVDGFVALVESRIHELQAL